MIGKQILHYKITDKLGEGGMGVVYKAEDTKLERTVALKFLSLASIGDEEKKRFKREAKAAASLNHPNIATVFAIDEADDQTFIAMEYIEGQSLEQMVGAHGGVPLRSDDAIDYATQIAAGLQAAHEKGIVHRDIKSANIMVTDKGVVKIMDFGLAKLTNRSKMTQLGTTLGTISYMSPEQAQGRKVDHRSDIWSLGVVLYEMISGQMPFKGDYEQAVIYSILHEEPEPLTALRSGVPIALDGILAKALAKDPKTRYQHVDELPADLQGLETASLNRSRVSTVSQPFESSKVSKGSRLPWIISGISVVALVTTLIFSNLFDDQPNSDTMRVNLTAFTAPNQSLLRTDVQALALSPDGNNLVYTVNEEGQTLLYMRSLNDFAVAPLKGTANARAPFFSPDGQWIGFVADGKLKKVSVSGGAVQTLCDATGFRGASWGPDNTIVLSPEFNSGLMAISADGGPLRQVSVLDSTQHERTHRWPQILPGGRWVLYTIGDPDNPNSYVDARLALQSLETGEKHLLNVRGEMARYVEPGFLVIARNGSLLAAPFSMKTYATTQSPLVVVDNVDGDGGSGISYFSISNNGRLVYISGVRNKELKLIWVDKQGMVEPLPLQNAAYESPRFSPDGKRLAVTVAQPNDSNSDIWIYSLTSRSFNRFTFGKSMRNPAWSPDGRLLYFISYSGEQAGIWVKPTDGSSPETLLAGIQPFQLAYVTPDGKQLILSRVGVGGALGAVYTLDLSKPEAPKAFFQSDVFSYAGNVSPDGRFITYGSTETGALALFVTTFSNQKNKWQVSSASGGNPLWSPDGRELYYISSLAKMMAVPVSTDPVFSSGTPRELFDVSQMFFPNTPVANYDISPDGKQFIMVRNTGEGPGTHAFNVILNWMDEVQDRFRTSD